MSLAIAEIRVIPRFLQVQARLSIMLSRVRVPPGGTVVFPLLTRNLSRGSESHTGPSPTLSAGEQGRGGLSRGSPGQTTNRLAHVSPLTRKQRRASKRWSRGRCSRCQPGPPRPGDGGDAQARPHRGPAAAQRARALALVGPKDATYSEVSAPDPGQLHRPDGVGTRTGRPRWAPSRMASWGKAP